MARTRVAWLRAARLRRAAGAATPLVIARSPGLTADTVVVDSDQRALIALLETKQMEVIPLKLRHSRMLGGGFHCVTLDTRRRGTMESYSS